jgi:hypothetical protein
MFPSSFLFPFVFLNTKTRTEVVDLKQDREDGGGTVSVHLLNEEGLFLSVPCDCMGVRKTYF